jgi:hypothetical protein
MGRFPITQWVTAGRKSAPRLGRSEAWAVAGLLGFAVVLPTIIGIASGALDLPRNDDWSYRRIALHLFQTGRFELDYANQSSLVGQVLLAQPLLWLSGGASWGFAVVGVLFESAAIIAGYLALRRLLAPLLAALAIGLLPLFPGYLPYAVSFMTDVPAIAAGFACLGLGMVAFERRPIRYRWLIASLAVGLFGFSIREFALAAPVTVVVAAVLAEPRRPRPWFAAIALFVASVAFFEWRSSLTGNYSGFAPSSAGAYRLPLAASSVALVLLPAAVVGLSRWRQRLRLLDVVLGIGIGVFLVSGPVTGLIDTGRLPQVLLDVNMTQWGAPAQFYLTGGRPILFPDPIWTALSSLALVATVIVAGVGGGIVGAYIRHGLARPASMLSRLASPAGLLVIFVAGTAAGMTWFGFRWWIYDRYFWSLVPPLAALLLYVPPGFRAPRIVGAAPDERPKRRTDAGLPVRAALTATAALLVIVLGAASVAYLLNSAAFDAARWRAGEALVQEGIPADSVDAGYEWVGYYASSVADFGHPLPGLNWWEGLWPGFHRCGLVASESQDLPSTQLVAVDWAAYRLLLFVGPDEPLYLYRVTGGGCP